MKRTLARILFAVVAATLILVVAVNALTPGIPEEPPTDLTMEIDLPDGTVATLGQLLAAAPPSGAAEQSAAAAGSSEEASRGGSTGSALAHLQRNIVEIGHRELDRGRTERALAIWRAVPRDHPHYARAQRYIGYKIYDKKLGQPGQGLAYVNRSMRADPMEGNVWQDAARIYWHALREKLE